MGVWTAGGASAAAGAAVAGDEAGMARSKKAQPRGGQTKFQASRRPLAMCGSRRLPPTMMMMMMKKRPNPNQPQKPKANTENRIPAHRRLRRAKVVPDAAAAAAAGGAAAATARWLAAKRQPRRSSVRNRLPLSLRPKSKRLP